jgi:DNA-directed RNA polymerase subunit N (RpoN/RPB10)
MEFPIRCFTCGLPISGKWKTYLDMVKAFRRQDGRSEKDELVYLTSTTQKTAEGRAMDELGLTRECCRRHFLGHPGL